MLIPVTAKVERTVDRELIKISKQLFFRSKSQLISFILRKAVNKPIEILTAQAKEYQSKVYNLKEIKKSYEILTKDGLIEENGLEIQNLLKEID